MDPFLMRFAQVAGSKLARLDSRPMTIIKAFDQGAVY